MDRGRTGIRNWTSLASRVLISRYESVYFVTISEQFFANILLPYQKTSRITQSSLFKQETSRLTEILLRHQHPPQSFCVGDRSSNVLHSSFQLHDPRQGLRHYDSTSSSPLPGKQILTKMLL
jgi:hypothetical protein